MEGDSLLTKESARWTELNRESVSKISCLTVLQVSVSTQRDARRNVTSKNWKSLWLKSIFLKSQFGHLCFYFMIWFTVWFDRGGPELYCPGCKIFLSSFLAESQSVEVEKEVYNPKGTPQ